MSTSNTLELALLTVCPPASDPVLPLNAASPEYTAATRVRADRQREREDRRLAAVQDDRAPEVRAVDAELHRAGGRPGQRIGRDGGGEEPHALAEHRGVHQGGQNDLRVDLGHLGRRGPGAGDQEYARLGQERAREHPAKQPGPASPQRGCRQPHIVIGIGRMGPFSASGDRGFSPIPFLGRRPGRFALSFDALRLDQDPVGLVVFADEDGGRVGRDRLRPSHAYRLWRRRLSQRLRTRRRPGATSCRFHSVVPR